MNFSFSNFSINVSIVAHFPTCDHEATDILKPLSAWFPVFPPGFAGHEARVTDPLVEDEDHGERDIAPGLLLGPVQSDQRILHGPTHRVGVNHDYIKSLHQITPQNMRIELHPSFDLKFVYRKAVSASPALESWSSVTSQAANMNIVALHSGRRNSRSL